MGLQPVDFSVHREPSRLTLLGLLLLALSATALAQYTQIFDTASFYYFGLSSLVASWAVFIFLAFAIGYSAGPATFLIAVSQSLAISTFVNACVAGAAYLVHLSHFDWAQYGKVASWGFFLFAMPFVSWQAIALTRLAKHLWGSDIRLGGLQLLGASVLSILIVPMYPLYYQSFDYRFRIDFWQSYQLITAEAPTNVAADEPTKPPLGMSEEQIYSQDRLLNDQLSHLEPSKVGDAPRYYFVAMAPDDEQRVFEREVKSVAAIADNVLGTNKRSIILVNSLNTAATIPMATNTSLKRSLEAMRGLMQAEKDVLVLYITSHGAKDYIVTKMTGANLDGLTSTTLKETLDGSGIKNVVVIISACHSGSFIDDLKGPNRLIMTAASADKTSFGCSDDRDWTFF